jgi:predicted branched-subunit amino acid permease
MPIIRNAIGIGVATGAYGLSFGALSVAAGLSVPQTCALSLLMFTGASQFAFVGLVAGGPAAAVATALLLGARNALYGLRLSALLPRRAAHLVIDESAAMALRGEDASAARLGFWATGASVFVCWNLATGLGAMAGAALGDPRTLGLDAAAPAAFLALLAPRLREARGTAALAAAAALVAVPFTPAGMPVLIAAAVAAALAAADRRGSPGRGDDRPASAAGADRRPSPRPAAERRPAPAPSGR